MNCVLNIAYDGTKYHGWQKQNNAESVCGVLEKAVKEIYKEDIEVTGCSRTDAGVHALDFVCNYFCDKTLSEDKIPIALNTKLPYDIRVKSARYEGDDFSSRFNARSKTYLYKTCCDHTLSPFLYNYVYHFPYDVDIEKMKTASKYFIGTHDFFGFMTQGSSQKTTVRTVNDLSVRENNGIIEFEINANAYLYNMVRIISGTLLYVGIGKIDADEIPDIIKSRDRRRAGITAKPQGLYLKEVIY